MTRAAPYARFSSDNQGDGSIEDQLRICREQAKREKSKIVCTYKYAKNGFGRLLDSARAEPVVIEKHGRAVVVVLAIEEYERLVGAGTADQPATPTTKTKGK